QGRSSKLRLASPSTSLIVISEYSNVESRHLTHTLGIDGFYSRGVSVVATRGIRWANILSSETLGAAGRIYSAGSSHDLYADTTYSYLRWQLGIAVRDRRDNFQEGFAPTRTGWEGLCCLHAYHGRVRGVPRRCEA